MRLTFRFNVEVDFRLQCWPTKFSSPIFVSQKNILPHFFSPKFLIFFTQIFFSQNIIFHSQKYILFPNSFFQPKIYHINVPNSNCRHKRFAGTSPNPLSTRSCSNQFSPSISPLPLSTKLVVNPPDHFDH